MTTALVNSLLTLVILANLTTTLNALIIIIRLAAHGLVNSSPSIRPWQNDAGSPRAFQDAGNSNFAPCDLNPPIGR